MTLVYKEWGTYVARVTFKIDIEEVNEYFQENYYFEGIRPIGPQDIEDAANYNHTEYLDQHVADREYNEAEFALLDLLSDYISQKKYEDYTHDIVDIDNIDDMYMGSI